MELPEPKISQHWNRPRRVEAVGAKTKLSRTLTSSYASSKRRQQEWMDKSASRDSQRNVEQACVVKKSEPDSQGASPNRFIIMFKNNSSSEKIKNLYVNENSESMSCGNEHGCAPEEARADEIMTRARSPRRSVENHSNRL